MNEQLAMTSLVTEINDPQLKQIRDRVYKTVVLAAAKAVGHLNDPSSFPMPRNRNSLEHLMLARLKERPDFQQQRATAKLKNVIQATGRARERLLGDLARVDLKRNAAVDEQARAIPSAARLSAETLQSAIAHGPLFVSHGAVTQVEPEIGEDGKGIRLPKGELVIRGLRKKTAMDMGELIVVKKPEAPDFVKPWRTLRLRIRKTICVDETDGFLTMETGDDEMIIGGQAIDTSGDMKKVGVIHLGHAFDDDEEVTYNPPIIFASYDLKADETITVDGKTEKLGWPRTYFAVVVLAEEDMGGFPDFLNSLAAMVLPSLKEEIAAALAVVGSEFGPIGAAIGAALGAVLGEIVDGIFEFLVSVWEDDTFVPLTLSQTLPFPMPPWGTTTSPIVQLGWVGHGGHYRIRFDWEMVP